MSQPPPPRYRIVEQGRRLIVIDNWARDKTPPAQPVAPLRAGRDLLPPKAGNTANRIVRAGDDGGALLRRLALIACGGAEDAEGRPIFSSAAWFDKKGRREFSLGPSAVQRLGGTVLTLLALIGFFVLLSAVIGFEIFVVSILLLILVGKNAGSLVTRWIDWIEKGTAD